MLIFQLLNQYEGIARAAFSGCAAKLNKSIKTNIIENAIRPLAIGRKNWLFCANEDSATRAAIVYTLIACCKIADVDPSQWLEDVLRKLPYYKRDNKDLSDLLPENWRKNH